MELSCETFRSLSRNFGYSEDALRRHKENHLVVDLEKVKRAKEEARQKALAEIRAKELEGIEEEVKAGIVGRLETCSDFFDQLKILRERAAFALEKAEGTDDIRAILLAVRELRDIIRIWAELEGKLATQPTVNILALSEWLALKELIVAALRPYPDALRAVRDALP